jgi:hypothetical protein
MDLQRSAGPQVRVLLIAREMSAAALFLGDDESQFGWGLRRCAVLQAQLYGAFLHPYGIERDDADYILGTFPIVNRNDKRQHGEERASRLALDAYDRSSTAMKMGASFSSGSPSRPAKTEDKP